MWFEQSHQCGNNTKRANWKEDRGRERERKKNDTEISKRLCLNWCVHREGITMFILICRRHLYRMPHYLMKRIKFVELKLFGHSSAIFIQLPNETMIFSWISLFTNSTIWGLVLPFNLPWRDLIKCYLAQFDIIVPLTHTHTLTLTLCTSGDRTIE